MSKREFLDNLRVARNLMVHGGVGTDSQPVDPAVRSGALRRAAIWLTPCVVKGFTREDFEELGTAQQQELADAVQQFERVATQVAPDVAATEQQYQEAKAVLEKILMVLGKYLPSQEEAIEVRNALGPMEFPAWVLNWDYEIGSDEEGTPAVWVKLYADDEAIASNELGRRATEMIRPIRTALKAAGVGRWPYIRLRTGREYKAG